MFGGVSHHPWHGTVHCWAHDRNRPGEVVILHSSFLLPVLRSTIVSYVHARSRGDDSSTSLGQMLPVRLQNQVEWKSIANLQELQKT